MKITSLAQYGRKKYVFNIGTTPFINYIGRLKPLKIATHTIIDR